MDSNKKEIKHQGIIRKITDEFYFVAVERTTACQGCTAKGFCNISSGKSEWIPVERLPQQNFCEGDEVTVSLTERMSWKAMFYGYLMPFLVLVSGIIVSDAATDLPQGIIGLIGIGALVAYYVVFSLFRERVNRQFRFKIDTFK
jgi:sigma-E factor negative regulatory protein RseC